MGEQNETAYGNSISSAQWSERFGVTLVLIDIFIVVRSYVLTFLQIIYILLWARGVGIYSCSFKNTNNAKLLGGFVGAHRFFWVSLDLLLSGFEWTPRRTTHMRDFVGGFVMFNPIGMIYVFVFLWVWATHESKKMGGFTRPCFQGIVMWWLPKKSQIKMITEN